MANTVDAVRAARAKLPVNWVKLMREDDSCPYYHHTPTGSVQWTRPTFEHDFLPEGWTEGFTEEGIFYCNDGTGQSQWTWPGTRQSAAPAAPVTTVAEASPPPAATPAVPQNVAPSWDQCRPPRHWGIIPRVVFEMYFRSCHPSSTDRWWERQTMAISFFEIYQGRVTNLIGADGPQLLKLRKGAFCDVDDPSYQAPVRSPHQLMDLLYRGLHNRTACATAMNHQSSRSHSVFIVHRQAAYRSGRVKNAAKMYVTRGLWPGLWSLHKK